MNAYVGFEVRRWGDTRKGVVDFYNTEEACVWWGHQRGHKTRQDGREWVPWSALEVVSPAGAQVSFPQAQSVFDILNAVK